MRMYLIILLVFHVIHVNAQTPREQYEAFRNNVINNYTSFRDKARSDYEEFRRQANEQYMEFMRKSWEQFHAFKGDPIPEDEVKPVPPVVMPEDDKNREIKDEEKPIVEVVPPTPAPEPQPEPIVPIEEQTVKENPIVKDEPIDKKPIKDNKPTKEDPIKKNPIEDKPAVVYHSFKYLGTEMKVRLDKSHRFHLASTQEGHVADAWNILCNSKYDNMLYDCLDLRKKHRLCDWAYLCMIDELTQSFCGKNTNEATLMKAYIYCQSGYKMRLAKAGGRLDMLFASKHGIYQHPYFDINGEKFYSTTDIDGNWQVFTSEYPKEQSMSLYVNADPKINLVMSQSRRLQSKQFPNVTCTVSINKNLIDFYNKYPSSEINDNFMTRWAMYANTPMCETAKKSLYPMLRSAVKGKSQSDAVNMILNWVQTAFVYGYDDKVWGGDRAFFPDETLYYPYCDCEDRSILFSRIVRDILGLEMVLIYYPGHLATAVGFTETVYGDYIVINGKRYTIADPTYINAPVGRTMPQMNNSTAKAIILK